MKTLSAKKGVIHNSAKPAAKQKKEPNTNMPQQLETQIIEKMENGVKSTLVEFGLLNKQSGMLGAVN